MALYVYIGHDGPRGIELRKIHRPGHLALFEPLATEARIRHAGPMLGPTGQPVGSVIIFEAESLDAARKLTSQDPYLAHGVFESHELHETRSVLPG